MSLLNSQEVTTSIISNHNGKMSTTKIRSKVLTSSFSHIFASVNPDNIIMSSRKKIDVNKRSRSKRSAATESSKLEEVGNTDSRKNEEGYDIRVLRRYRWHDVEDTITAMHVAVKDQNYELIRCIGSYIPGMVDRKSSDRGDTPLHYGVGFHPTDSKLLKILLSLFSYSADTKCGKNGLFGDRATPLHIALEGQASASVISKLLKASLSPLKKKDGRGLTPFEIAWNAYPDGEDRIRILEMLNRKNRPIVLRFKKYVPQVLTYRMKKGFFA